MHRAIVYVATGDNHRQEAVRSALSVKAVMPHMPVLLHTDSPPPDPGGFDEVHIIKDAQRRNIVKARLFESTAAEQVLFLDTDTCGIGPLDEAFDILDRFELAAVRAPRYHDPGFRRLDLWAGMPAAFTELNSGVLFLRNTERVRGTMRRWAAIHEEQAALGIRRDQPAFARALWESDLQFYVLPDEYNVRLISPALVRGPARILHGRFPESVMRRLAVELGAGGTALFNPAGASVSDQRAWNFLSSPIGRATSRVRRWFLPMKRMLGRK